MGRIGHAAAVECADPDTPGEAPAPPRASSTSLVLAISLLHLVLCVWFHYDRPWLGDEWGSYLAFSETYRNLLTHFGGWRTMNFYLAGLKVIHDYRGGANWLLVLPGILCGLWLVWLAAGLALRLGSGRRAAVAAALLVAVNPYVVRYSITIRSYIFLAAFSAAMMLFLLDWRRSGRWRDGFLCGVFGALALLANLNATYSYAAIGTLAVCWTLGRARRHEPGWLKRFWRFALPVGGLAALAAAAYIPQLSDIQRFRELWHDTPPVALTFLPTVFGLFFGAGYLLLPTLAMLLYAAWRACRDRRESQWMLVAAMVAVGAISFAGVSHVPSAYARFLIAILPWLVVLMADGLGDIAERWRVATPAIVAVLVVCNLLALSDERQREHARPWHRISQYLRHEMTPDDRSVVIGRVYLISAMRVYGVSTGRSVAAALASLPPDKPARLMVVVSARGFAPKLPTREFGEVRVMTVEGTRQAMASQMLREMIAGANGRVSGELAEVYRQIADLLRWTGQAEAAMKYDLLHSECQLHDSRLLQHPDFLGRRSAGAGR